MFGKRYTPSVKNNMQLKEKVVNEINSFIYRLERGRVTSEAEQDTLVRIIYDLKTDVEALNNSVGTGEEDIEATANKILGLLKDLKKISEQDMIHRIQDVADELDYHVVLMRDIFDGVTAVPTEEEEQAAKISYARRKLNARLSELNEIKESFTANSRRLEKEIQGYEKDLTELDAQMVNEDNERKINELFKKINSLKTKLDSLIVRKSNYTTCFNLLDMIYVNAAEIVEASDFAGEEIGKAKALLNIGKLRKVLSEPDKALLVLKRMQADIKAVYDRTQNMDAKLAELNTTSATVSQDALAYKAELMRKKREKEGHADLDVNAGSSTTINTETISEEDN